MKIGSFNVLNLKTDTSSKGSFSKEAFKLLRIEKIAELIAREDLAVVALQEIQSRKTVEKIVDLLNYGAKVWDYVHCDRIYEDLNRYSTPGEKMLEDRAELAFIYDSRRLEFVKDYVLYKSLHEQFITAIEAFITILLGSATLVSLLLDDDKQKTKEEKSDSNEIGKATDDKQKHKKEESAFNKIDKATAGALATYGSMQGMVKTKDYYYQKAVQFLGQTIRPPLVAIFKPVTTNRNVQLRFINMHSQFNFEEGQNITKRKLESRFVLQYIFHIVNTQRVMSLSNLYSTAYTIAAGDFNLTTAQLNEVISKGDVQSVEPNLVVLQEAKSTINCTNKEEVESGKEPEFIYEFVHDYDHFVIDKSMWGEDTECVNGGVVMDLDILRPVNFINPYRQAISDHHPIVISTTQF